MNIIGWLLIIAAGIALATLALPEIIRDARQARARATYTAEALDEAKIRIARRQP